MTTYPVVERIRQTIVTRLETMLSDGVESTSTTAVVEPIRLGGYSPDDYQIVVTQDESVRVPELSTPGNPPAVCYQQAFNVRCKLLTDEETVEPSDQLVNQFASDVQKRITSYGNAWYSMGGLAIDSEFGDPRRITPSGGAIGMILPLLVTYRVSENNPYTVRA